MKLYLEYRQIYLARPIKDLLESNRLLNLLIDIFTHFKYENLVLLTGNLTYFKHLFLERN